MWFYSGGPPSTVIVKLFADGSANLNMGASDIGTGTKTWAAMIVAEELGVPLDKIRSSTPTPPRPSTPPPPAAARRCRRTRRRCGRRPWTSRDSSWIRRGAARDHRRTIFDSSDLTITSSIDPEKSLGLAEVERLNRRGLLMGTGYRDPNPDGTFTSPFAAQFCEVEVNTRTGEIRILRFLGAHDSGRVLNRLTYDNQVFGGMAMGIGLGVTEERILDGQQTGKMVNPNFHDYKIPTILDVADAHACLPIDVPDDEFNSTGAKGLGEPATIPTAAAVGNAVANALGGHPLNAPMTPEKILDLVHSLGKEA